MVRRTSHLHVDTCVRDLTRSLTLQGRVPPFSFLHTLCIAIKRKKRVAGWVKAGGVFGEEEAKRIGVA